MKAGRAKAAEARKQEKALIKKKVEEKSIRAESNLALYGGGADGLALYRRFFKQLSFIRKKHKGHLCIFVECNPEQMSTMKNIIKKNLPDFRIEIKKELAGFDRMIVISS